MRRRLHGAGAALTRRCCATWPAHAPNRQRCSAPPRAPPRTAFYSPLASRCLHPCCTTSAASVTHRVFAAPRYSAFTVTPPTPAPLAHRSPWCRSRRLLTAAPPASALITDCAAPSAPARSPPADAPHATSPLALRLTYRAARSLLLVAPCRSIRAHSAPRCSRTAGRPLAPLASHRSRAASLTAR